jgi:hypothetical protein
LLLKPRQYITEAGIRLNGLAHAYPRGIAAPAPSGYEELAERVLDRDGSRLAVLNCLTGFETHRNAYFAAAVASAVNDWLRDEMLSRAAFCGRPPPSCTASVESGRYHITGTP